MTASIVIHTRDSDCAPFLVDEQCSVCGVSHTAPPCRDCGGRGFHLGDGEGEEPCGYGKAPAIPFVLSPVDRAAWALAQAFGFESASDPTYLAACERGSDSGGSNIEADEAYTLTNEDRDLLRELENAAVIRSFDARKEFCP